eukprot:COSAG01_NODE_1638_length_9653_cov_230.802282_5_plen_49_part_00
MSCHLRHPLTQENFRRDRAYGDMDQVLSTLQRQGKSAAPTPSAPQSQK